MPLVAKTWQNTKKKNLVRGSYSTLCYSPYINDGADNEAVKVCLDRGSGVDQPRIYNYVEVMRQKYISALKAGLVLPWIQPSSVPMLQ